MLKKFLVILIGVIVVVGALLPFFGNKVAQEEIQNRIDVLVSYGVSVSNETSSSNYFQTKNHYEFRVSDTQKFMQYISQFWDAQIPAYTDAMIDGVLVGLDVAYDNFPLSDAISLDIYPLEFSKNFHEALKKNDTTFAEYFENFLKSKGVLYHLDYRILQGDFSGYIKDIDESVSLKDGATLTLLVDGVTYNGAGQIIAPDALSTEIKKILFGVKDKDVIIDLGIENASSEAVFEAQSSYKATSTVGALHFLMKEGSYKDITLDTKDAKFDFFANTKGAKAEFGGTFLLKDFIIKANNQLFNASYFHYDLLFKEVDKDSYEELRVLLAELKNDNSDAMQTKVQESAIKLLSQGLEMHLNDFSVKDISLNEAKNKGGFKVASRLVLAPNANLSRDIKEAPFRVLNSLRIDTTLTLSKTLFAYMNEQAPMSSMALGYAKEDGDNYVFELNYQNDSLTVNGKPLR